MSYGLRNRRSPQERRSPPRPGPAGIVLEFERRTAGQRDYARAALTASFESTGVWPNIVGRRKDGKVEIAYGHHRVEAARRISRKLGGEIEVNGKPINDETMLKMAHGENRTSVLCADSKNPA